jgi:FkbM family methyltransferase
MEQFLRKVRVALTPRSALLKARLANGAVVYGKNRAGFGGRGIYVLREEIKPEFQHLEKFLGTQGVFIDVGANTGIYSLKAAKHFGGKAGVVLALEPFPDVLATLYRSVQANGFSNVRLRNLCASDRTGTATFWMNGGKPHAFSLHKTDAHAASFSTLAVRLDDLCAWESLERCDYLKIDAEGAESQILSGAQGIISAHRPIIQAEVSIHAVNVSLPEYSAFRAPNSANNVYIPNEHPAFSIPATLGWVRL